MKAFTSFNELIGISGSSNLVLNRLSQLMIKATLMPEESYALFLFLQRQGWSNLYNWADMLRNACLCSNIDVGDHCLNMLKAIMYMLSTASSQATSSKDKPQTSLIDCFRTDERLPLKEISLNSQINSTPSKMSFNKRQFLDLCRNN